ncbi:hypothetical protein M413DRAFT_235653 [Hebeloma cylindrosporum]|uniref:F-box domain-containing protein n=1 Tax=Hebeloma cylindrosporum TaxID=76867 RepID=A0A0C3C467_HEBCY|nr:hypothetical protein M413DRAFT_235653 [Hebeloma cylindrosporum h7]
MIKHCPQLYKMSLQQLPPELLCAIFSHLPPNDGQSLRALALTCRAFISPAQASLFDTVFVSSESDACIVLAKLESIPHIKMFARRLSLRDIHRPWIQHSQVLHDILGLVYPYIVSLDILQRRRRPDSPRFAFPSLAQLTLLEKISLSEEDVLELKTMEYGDNGIPTFLNYFPKLRAITLDGCYVHNEAVDSSRSIAAPIFLLERLDIRWSSDSLLLDWLMPALSLLQKLHVTLATPNLSTKLAQAGESL